MAYKVATEYPHGVNGVTMTASQGAFVPDDRFKSGGEFENPMHAGEIVALDPVAPRTVKKCGVGDLPVGKAAGEPFGPIEGQGIAVDLFGDRIYEFEIDVGSDEFGISDYLKPLGPKMTKCEAGERSAFLAMEPMADPSKGGVIPVLCGFYGGVSPSAP